MADNVLGTLFGDIANAIRSKTGEPETAKMKPSEFPTKILGIEVGGGVTAEDIIPEQELTFVYDESNGVYTLGGHNLFNITSIALGKEYKVVWGSDEYSCTAVEGIFLGQYPMIGIGNPYAIGGENNNMPFAIGYITIPDDGDSQYSCIIVSLDGSASKRVRVYQTSSGASSDLVKWVTFIGADGTELYRMPVLDGDDCKDPYTRGDIEKPTKESTVSQVFTYNGWALTDGGTADANALKAVTEDRTVYAAFASTVRKYTITYYDSDGTTVLKTEEKTYGSIIGYIPEKSGYSFVEWQPSVETVTGNASYVAMWQEAVTFARGSWEDIIEIAESGNAANYFAIGDTRTDYLNYTDGTSEEITLTIVAINVDTESGMTLASNVLEKTHCFNTMTTAVGWYDQYGGNDVSLRNHLRKTILPALPATLQTGIKTVDRTFSFGTTSGTSSDKIFAFRHPELYMYYPFFHDKAGTPNVTKQIGYKIDGTPAAYFLRDKSSTNTKNVYYVKEDGTVAFDKSQTAQCGVRFGICI